MGAQRMCILAPREAGAQALRTPATSRTLADCRIDQLDFEIEVNG